ncbi:MAG: SRPBCC family protein, partial [Vicinamibacterales bacterium]
IGLTDYLAGAKGFLDLMIDQAEGRELIVLPGEHSYAVAANYKFMCENSYDGYHVPSTHMSYLEYLQERDLTAGKSGEMANLLKKYSTEGSGWGLGHGHGGMESWVPTGRPVAQWVPSWGLELKQQIENTYQRLVERYGAKRAERIAQLQKNMVIFPNLVINDNVGFTVRTIEPTSVSSMRIHAWALAPAGESSDIKKIRLENFVGFLGPAGMGSSDDVEMMEICQRGLEHTPLEWNELSKGMRSDADRRWEESGPNDEAQIRAYWAQWDLLMRGEMAFDQPECPRKVEVA